jgi:hypothetical protein
LADFSYNWLRPTFLAKIRQKQKDPCQPFLARIEQLIDQVLLDTTIASQEVRTGKGYVLGVNSNHWFASWGNPISSDQPSHMPRPLPHRTEPIPRLNQAAAVLYCVT